MKGRRTQAIWMATNTYTPSHVQLQWSVPPPGQLPPGYRLTRNDSTVTVNAVSDGPTNSANGPLQFNMDLRIDKTFDVFGRAIRATLTGTNILDTGTDKYIDPTTGKAYTDGQGLWGHYEKSDIQIYRHQEIVKNPSVLSQGRNLRVSFSYDW